jgi:serine/threonine protein kinase|tara:strand:+ start:1501 stop:2124 length:624 start_codon:yes stop_codon:yes gene_type:complete
MKNSNHEKNKLVGEGNSGTIYETKDNIAKKVFKNKKFFEAELSILEKIKGLKHVIKVKKVSKEENTIYMEFVPYNLDKILTGKYDKKLHQFNKKKIMVEILEGLKSLHNSGIIHNDFKTKNIQVTENSDIKIIDFDSSDFGLKSIPKRIEDINKAKIIILQILNKRSYNHVLKNKGKYLDEIKDDKNVMEFGRNNLSELINYVKKMN